MITWRKSSILGKKWNKQISSLLSSDDTTTDTKMLCLTNQELV